MHEVADSRVFLQCDSGSVDLESIARQLSPAWLTQALAQRSSTVLVQSVKIVRVVAGCSIKVWVELAVPKLLHDHGRLVDGFARLEQFGQTQPKVILVGDEHLGNLYLEADGRPGFLDFQARIAPWCQGIAYFMGAGLDIADRRKWERGLLEHYLEQLAASGIEPPEMTEAWDAYCRQLLFGFFVWATNGSHFQAESVNTANTARFALAMIDNDTLGRLAVHRQ